jgi:hypothetical protein
MAYIKIKPCDHALADTIVPYTNGMRMQNWCQTCMGSWNAYAALGGTFQGPQFVFAGENGPASKVPFVGAGQPLLGNDVR